MAGLDADVTGLLARMTEGDQAAYDRLLPMVYGELKRLARGFMSQERDGHTLQTTALIHEACLRLFQSREIRWEDRAHFFKLASRAMRRVLIDYARERHCFKRGGNVSRLPLDEVLEEAATLFCCPDLDLLALNMALDRLEADFPRQGQVVHLVFFAGLSHHEAANVLGVSPKTVDRDWLFARAWLLREMDPSAGRPDLPAD